MKPRTLLVLLVVVAGLGAFIWFYERELPGSEERAERAKRVLRGLEADQVTALVIEEGGETVRLERVAEPEDDAAGEDAEDAEDAEEDAAPPEPSLLPEPEPEWRIAAPEPLAGARADRFAVERLLDGLAGLEKSRTLEDAERAELGLDAPRARVTVVEEGGEETTLEIGSEVPASTSMLAAIAGRPEVYVVGGALYHDLDREPGGWRDREILPVRRDEIERLALAPAGGERVVLARRGDDEYWLDEPLVDRADTAAVEQLVTDLTGLRAQEFVDEPGGEPGGDPGEHDLAPPRGVVEVTAGGEPVRLEIGGETDGGSWYGRVGAQVFEAGGRLPEHLAKGAAEWQSRSLSARRLYQIDRVTVEEGDPGAGGGPLVLDREGPDWRRGGEPIPYTPVSDFLFAVTDARAERVARRDAARAAGHLGAPALSITLAGAEEAEGTETVALYPPVAGGEVPATVTGRDYALYLAPATAETVRDSLARLREAEPLPEEEPEGGEDDEDGIEVEVEEGD